ncbi:uncharacterized protein LOC143293525 [Babylonia areolata]|uniref:uncharacterized protein LOC143293525 n=1 Tax=Babylonia areolata TaxID=304850 RepID=UPI003FD01A2B
MWAAWVGLILTGVAGSLAAEPTRCCLDKQYSARLGVVGEVLADDPSNAAFIDGTINIGLDYYTDRYGMISHFTQPDGSVKTTYELRDYATRRIYTRVNNDTCTYKDMESFDVMRPPCIPESATYIGPSTLGYGHQSMNLHTWSFPYQTGVNKTSQFFLSVTADHCVPVVETIVGEIGGVPLEESLFFVDYHPGNDRLHNLDIPQNCQPAPSSRK